MCHNFGSHLYASKQFVQVGVAVLHITMSGWTRILSYTAFIREDQTEESLPPTANQMHDNPKPCHFT